MSTATATAEPKKSISYHEELLAKRKLDETRRLIDQINASITSTQRRAARLDADIKALKGYATKAEAVSAAIADAFPKALSFELIENDGMGRTRTRIDDVRQQLVALAHGGFRALEDQLAEKQQQRANATKDLKALDKNLATAEADVKTLTAMLKEG